MSQHPDRFYLSALSRSFRDLQPPNPGRWRRDPQFLEHYSSAIRIEGELKDQQVPPSVPSVFARPIQFFQALSREDHPTHRSVIAQWRGLLAAIALRQQFGLPLRVEPFSVEEPEERGAEAIRAGTQGVDDLHLRTMLWNQLPQPVERWRHWWMLYCDNQLIGATSPWSIVYTPANYNCPARVPWQEDGRFADPVSHLDPGGTGRSLELAVLHRWIQLLLDRQQDWGFGDDSKSQAVAKLLSSWEKEIARYRNDSVQIRQLNGDSLQVRTKPYRHFLEAPDLDPLHHDSDYEFERLDGKRVLLLTRQNLDPATRVFGPVLIGHLDRSQMGMPGSYGPAGWKSRTEKVMNLPYVIAEEAFLCSKLVEVKLDHGALKRGTDEFALPLTPEFFKYFSYQRFLENRRILEVVTANQQVIVRLRMPLDTGQELLVEKIYDRSADVFELVGGVPAAAFWPDFLISDWHENFALYRPTEGSNLAAAPIALGGKVGKRSDWRAPHLLHIWRDHEPAIGFVLYGREEDTGRYEEVGLLLRDVRTFPSPPNKERSWHVAVDFGTSSTHVMYVEGDGREARPLVLEGRTVLMTDAEEGARQEVASALYPEERSEPPFVTVLYGSTATLLSHVPTHERFLPRFRFNVPRIPDESLRIFANVKWGRGTGGTSEDAPLREYLRGLLRYIVCEARAAGVGKVEIEWSYPLALPRKARSHMGRFWKSAGASFVTGIEVNASLTGCSESEAICRHLASLGGTLFTARAEALSIAVDVGGGSSDAAFWIKGRLMRQVSLKAAGNDILANLCGLNGFLKSLYEISMREECPFTTEQLKIIETQAVLYTNAVLTQAVDASGRPVDPASPSRHPVAAALLEERGVDSAEPPWLYIRSLAYLFFVGIAFHLGLLARNSIPVIRRVNLYFGGRGSSLLAWIGDGEQVGLILTQAFLAGLTRDDGGKNADVSVSILGPAIQSDPHFRPKEETARGLLAPQLSEGVIRTDPEIAPSLTTVLGEIGWANEDGTELTWDAEIDTSRVLALRPPPNLFSSYVAQFLDAVLPLGFEDLHLDEARLRSLDLRIDKIQDKLIHAATDEDGVLQSVFACELKTLMEDYVRKVLVDERIA